MAIRKLKSKLKQPIKRVLKKRVKLKRKLTVKTVQQTPVQTVLETITAKIGENTLKAQHQRFVDEYMIDSNAYRSYCMAGYKGRGNSGYVSASTLLRHPKVAAEIEHRRGLIAASLKVNSEDVLKELKTIAFSNIGDYVEFGGKRVRIKPSHELTREALSVIEQVTETVNTAGMKSIKLKLHPKLAALTILAKYTDVDKGDGDKGETAETLAQAMSDIAKQMTSSLPTSENRTVGDGEKLPSGRKAKKKKKDDKECPMCEIPKLYCDCDN